MTQSHCVSLRGSRDECRTAPGGRRPLDQANRLEPQVRLYRQSVNRIHIEVAVCCPTGRQSLDTSRYHKEVTGGTEAESSERIE